MTFDSKKERDYYIILEMLLKNKQISDLKTQVKFELQPSFKFKGKTIRAITYIADFTYIDNVIEGCLRCCSASEDVAGQAYNIGAGGREYLIDVYHDICTALGTDMEPNYGPSRAGDIRDSNADISKAREKLGYDPQYDFTQGIKLAINWYRDNLQ